MQTAKSLSGNITLALWDKFLTHQWLISAVRCTAHGTDTNCTESLYSRGNTVTGQTNANFIICLIMKLTAEQNVKKLQVSELIITVGCTCQQCSKNIKTENKESKRIT